MCPYAIDLHCSDISKRLDPRYQSNRTGTPAKALTPPSDANLDTRKLVNVIVAKDFNLAPNGIQIQSLEVGVLLHSLLSLTKGQAHPPEAYLQPHDDSYCS
jgi:hypothetical protein